MSFNKNVQLDPGRVRTRSTGGRGAAIGGGSVLMVIAALVLSQVTGVDLTGLVAGTQPGAQQSVGAGVDTSMCTTGDSANQYTQCRMVATAESLDAVWQDQLPAQAGVAYQQPQFVLWDGSYVSSACGNASSAVGPFYCPGDSSVYLDMSFFSQMETTLGAKDAPLAQEYIVAHEFGHHIQNQLGVMDRTDRSGKGATSDSVRTELQADCYAGLWVYYASSTIDPQSGQPFLVRPTQEEIQTALDAAAAVGDDHIQQRSAGRIDADSWTHGSSQQRVRWFTTGMETGSVQQCDTFSVPDHSL